MRNSKKAQALADNCAKAHGFFCASYRGRSSEELVYEPLNSNSENNPRIPSYIIIRGSEAEYVQGMEYMDVLDGDEVPLISSKGVKRMRDLVQFVPFKKYENDEKKLSAEVLEEIPRQIEEYYSMNNLYPNSLNIPKI